MKSVFYVVRVNGIRHVACVETQTAQEALQAP